MSTEILAQALQGAARGQLIGGAARANREASIQAARAGDMKAQAIAYLSLLLELQDEHEALIKKYNENIEVSSQLGDLYKSANQTIRSMNADKLGLWEDRERAYDFIGQMSAVIREVDDLHPILNNPNAVLHRIQQGSRQALDDAIVLFNSNDNAQFSREHAQGELEEARDLRGDRGDSFGRAAENGELSPVNPDTYGKE